MAKDNMNFKNEKLKKVWDAFNEFHDEVHSDISEAENAEGIFVIFMDADGMNVASVGALNPNQITNLAIQLKEYSENILKTAIKAIEKGDFRRFKDSGESSKDERPGYVR